MHQFVAFDVQALAFHRDVTYIFVRVKAGTSVTDRYLQVFANHCAERYLGVCRQPPGAVVFHTFAADGCPRACLVREIIYL